MTNVFIYLYIDEDNPVEREKLVMEEIQSDCKVFDLVKEYDTCNTREDGIRHVQQVIRAGVNGDGMCSDANR